MGLDMYLDVVKEEYVSKYRKKETLVREYPNEMKKFFGDVPETITRKTYYNVGYWRKANAIHNWFVQNCGGGVDECQPISVSLEKLEELKNICEMILEDKEQAPRLLPTQNGFFFGSTEFDEYYYQDIEDTIKMITPVIDFLKDDEIKEQWCWEVIYQASW